jgi:hypothetical protein
MLYINNLSKTAFHKTVYLTQRVFSESLASPCATVTLFTICIKYKVLQNVVYHYYTSIFTTYTLVVSKYTADVPAGLTLEAPHLTHSAYSVLY